MYNYEINLFIFFKNDLIFFLYEQGAWTGMKRHHRHPN